MWINKYLGNNKLFLFCIFTFVSIVILYYKSLNYYFFQDDWFHINISHADNLKEFINLFKIRTDIIAWRPISKQLFFFIDYRIFGLNPIPAHLIFFTFFIFNGLILYTLTFKIINSVKISLITVFLYMTSSIHFITLSWISAGEYVIGTFFWLLSSLTYVNFIKTNKLHFYLASIVLFILCLLSTEFALTWPFIIVGFNYLNNNNQKNQLKIILEKAYLILPFIVVIIFYLVLRFVVFPLPAKGDYQPAFGLKTINTYIWYIIWSFNIPEVFKNQILISRLQFSQDPSFLIRFAKYSMPFLITLIFLFLSIFYTFLINIKKRNSLKQLLICGLFFTTTLLPVLFLPNHNFPHYLSIPSISVYVFLGIIFSKLNSKNIYNNLLLALTICSWFTLSFITLSFTREVHWIPGEQSISKSSIQDILYANKYVGKNSQIYLRPSMYVQTTTVQLKQALMDQEALKVIYNDKTIKTVFVDFREEFPPQTSNNYYVNLK